MMTSPHVTDASSLQIRGRGTQRCQQHTAKKKIYGAANIIQEVLSIEAVLAVVIVVAK